MKDFLKDIEDRRRRQKEEAARVLASLTPIVEEEEVEEPEIEVDFHQELPEVPAEEIENYSGQNKQFEETITSLQTALQEKDFKIQKLEDELKLAQEKILKLEEKAGTERYPEGATATNSSTNEKVVYKNGKWVPLDEEN
jgi:uncharacterized coiled-coil protein SlyX